MKKIKISLTISLLWIVLVGYLVWANGLLARGSKTFRWDEWIWFGLVPAITPYIFKLDPIRILGAKTDEITLAKYIF